MKNLFNPDQVDEVKQRIARLTPESPRQWGKMNSAQMLAHCSIAFQSAMGEVRPPRAFIGRLIGRMVKPVALRDEQPMLRNAQAATVFIVTGNPEFAGERERLSAMIDRFAGAGPAGCTTHPHFFFGCLTPEEWSVLMYKHLDHHLRQFGA
jgi:hypothetical protein